jgi:Flp pilus assembly protein TadD
MRWVWRTVTCAALALLVWLPFGGYDFLREKRFSALARYYEAHQQTDEAAFYAGRAWQINPRNDDALEILARLSREYKKGDALRWNGLWAENNPRDPRRQIEFARLIAASGQTEAADKVLARASKLPGTDPLLLAELQAAVAIERQEPDKAEAIYRQLIVSHPDRPPLAYNLAALLLASPLASKQEEGHERLRDMWEKKQMPLEVSRSLLQWALLKKQPHAFPTQLEFLETTKQATLMDHLLVGQVLLLSDGTLPKEWFGRLSSRCRLPAEAYAAISWLREQKLFVEALAWLESLPPRLRHSTLVRIARAEILGDLNRWEQITAELTREKWEGANHYRLAFLQEAYLHQNPAGRATVVRSVLWDQMVSSVLKVPGDAPRLHQLVHHWNWPEEERERLLAALMKTPQISRPMLISWLKEAEDRQDTLFLYRAAGKLLELEPESVVIRNNVASYGLLLEKDLPACAAMAEKLFREHPENSGVRTTWAFALYRQNRLPEALAVLQALPPDALQQSGTALYYSVVLHALGQKKEATAVLQNAVRKSRLLPEEILLLKKIRD